MAPSNPPPINTHVQFADAVWAELTDETTGTPPRFDRATVRDLPAPAQRYLEWAIPEGAVLSSMVELSMTGEIKLVGRWLPFRARQVLRAGVGFVWAPVVGNRWLRVVGADVLGSDEARMEFLLYGRLPLVRGQGPDIRRSAQGRLAAETVVWLPQALTPQLGARWREVDDRRAIVTLDAAGLDVDVEIDVDEHGRIHSLGLQRWSDSADPPAFVPFGGSVDEIASAADGVRIAGGGVVGWQWGTPDQPNGEFFRYRITGAEFAHGPAPPGEPAPR